MSLQSIAVVPSNKRSKLEICVLLYDEGARVGWSPGGSIHACAMNRIWRNPFRRGDKRMASHWYDFSRVSPNARLDEMIYCKWSIVSGTCPPSWIMFEAEVLMRSSSR